MRVTPIPDAELWPGAERHVIAPPDGDLTNPDILACEAVVDLYAIDEAGTMVAPRFSVRCVLEDGDLVKLAEGGTIWISFLHHMVPFSVLVEEKQ